MKHFYRLRLHNEQKAGAVCTHTSCWPDRERLTWLSRLGQLRFAVSFVPPPVTWTLQRGAPLPCRIMFQDLYLKCCRGSFISGITVPRVTETAVYCLHSSLIRATKSSSGLLLIRVRLPVLVCLLTYTRHTETHKSF